MAMSFSFILGLLAFILGVIGGVMSHTGAVRAACRVVCLALIVLIGGRLG